MDGRRFDDLTRLAGSLTRRQVLRRGGGALLGVVLAGRALRTKAFDCAQCLPNTVCCPGEMACCFTLEECCDFQCCRDGLQCLRDTSPPRCVPCTSGIRCGSKCCDVGEECQNEQCVLSCPASATKCGTNCCASGQTCDNGQCINACPAGRAARRRRGVAAQAGCEPPPPPCRKGTVRCGGHRGRCVPRCDKKSFLNHQSCKCVKKCAKDMDKCGKNCFDPESHVCCDGGLCEAGEICCGGECNEPGSECCGKRVCQPGEYCCGSSERCCPDGRRCCGDHCCPENQECKIPSTGFCCPFNTEYCGGATCCGVGEVCDQQHNHCCPLSQPVYCPSVDRCAIRRQDCP